MSIKNKLNKQTTLFENAKQSKQRTIETQVAREKDK